MGMGRRPWFCIEKIIWSGIQGWCIEIYVTQNQSTIDGSQGKKRSIFRMKLRLGILGECNSSYTQTQFLEEHVNLKAGGRAGHLVDPCLAILINSIMWCPTGWYEWTKIRTMLKLNSCSTGCAKLLCWWGPAQWLQSEMSDEWEV